MLDTNTKTSFKIGGSVGIIILLLGIAVVFGIFQMSKVSQEVIEISEEYSPIQMLISDVSNHQLNQEINFEKIMRFSESQNDEELDKAKEAFWFSGGIIESTINRAKMLTQAGIDISTSEESEQKFQLLQSKIEQIERIHLEFEESARESFTAIDDQTQSHMLQVQITNQKGIEIQKEIDLLTTEIAGLIEQSTNNIEQSESTALTGQVIIISIVGTLAGALGFFLSQINKDLKKEVDVKTKELQNANKKLQQLDKMKDEFIGIASHELKSPIQPIFGFAELAKAGDIDQNEAWDGVTELAHKLQDLANDVLDVSRIESNRLVLYKEKISINDLIKDTVKPLKISISKEVQIQENLDENITLEMDRVRMGQVFRNILTNAIKFTKNGIIKISTNINWENNTIQVRISDSGMGIPKDVLPNIFGKFVTKGHAQENTNGTGLGLFLCKGIVEAHGGEIVARNNKTQGATFEFTIPIQKEITQKQITK